MLNKLMLIGRLVKDPVVKTLPNGKSRLALFTVATNHSWVDAKTKEKKESVEFHSAVCWGKVATIASKYLHKGSRLYLEGRLVSRNWQDSSGKTQHRTEVLASFLIMLGDAKKPAPAEVEIEEVPVMEEED